MKITAVKEHKCFCCGAIIKKGEECLVFFVNSPDPSRSEFDVIYTCIKCHEEEKCRIKIRQREEVKKQ